MKSSNFEIQKKFKIIKRGINFFNLDLTNLVVYTELGSNDYLFTPIIASLANAKKVYGKVIDSNFGRKDNLISKFKKIQSLNNFPDTIEFVRDNQGLDEADIVTNSGFVRPIDKKKIDLMKKTAVIPLMWETWEFRPSEIDFIHARNKGILILGTYEDFLYTNNGFLVTKLLFEQGLGVYKDNILVISSGRIGDSISNFFKNTYVKHDRITLDKKISKKENKFIISKKNAMKKIFSYDALIIAEHYNNADILSNNGIFNCNKLKSENPNVKIIHICGNINLNDVMKSKLSIFPKKVAPFGFMSVGAAHLDSHAVLELNIAGLRVGEIMSRNRLRYNIKTAYKKSINHKIVNDFLGGYFNYIPKI